MKKVVSFLSIMIQLKLKLKNVNGANIAKVDNWGKILLNALVAK